MCYGGTLTSVRHTSEITAFLLLTTDQKLQVLSNSVMDTFFTDVQLHLLSWLCQNWLLMWQRSKGRVADEFGSPPRIYITAEESFKCIFEFTWPDISHTLPSSLCCIPRFTRVHRAFLRCCLSLASRPKNSSKKGTCLLVSLDIVIHKYNMSWYWSCLLLDGGVDVAVDLSTELWRRTQTEQVVQNTQMSTVQTYTDPRIVWVVSMSWWRGLLGRLIVDAATISERAGLRSQDEKQRQIKAKSHKR